MQYALYYKIGSAKSEQLITNEAVICAVFNHIRPIIEPF